MCLGEFTKKQSRKTLPSPLGSALGLQVTLCSENSPSGTQPSPVSASTSYPTPVKWLAVKSYMTVKLGSLSQHPDLHSLPLLTQPCALVTSSPEHNANEPGPGALTPQARAQKTKSSRQCGGLSSGYFKNT